MLAWVKNNFTALIVGAVVMFFLVAIAMPNFIRVKSRADSSGVLAYRDDGYAGESAPMSSQSSADYDSSFREQTRSSNQNYAGGDLKSAGYMHIPPPQPGDPAGSSASESSVIIGTLEDAGLLEKVSSWMLPEAYAQDHELDERYLVRDGDLSLEVDDYGASVDEVSAIARLYDGMVSDSHTSKQHDDTRTGWIKLRIPSENFFEAWDDLQELGEVYEENVSSEDVSQQYVGYVSRVKNLMAEQVTLQKMLEEALAVQRARGLGEGYSILLDTQERLFNVTGQLESAEDRLNALADKITRSTITVHLTEVRDLPAQVKEEFSWGFGTTAGSAFNDLQKNLRGAAQGIIYFLITCWTWLIPWAIVIFIAVKLYKRYAKPQLAKALAPKDPAPLE